MKKQHGFLRAVSMGLSVCLLCGALAVPSFADNTKQQQLEQQKKELQTQLEQEKAELKNIQSTKTAAQKNKKNLENQSNLIKSQITVLIDQITDTSDQVAQKQQQVEEKQGEIDQRWGDFKQRMVAMQQLHDGGAVAMLSSCSSLYEMLTFNDTLEQITEKDNEVLEELQTARQALADEKAQLEGKQTELATNIRQQDATIEQAAADEQAQQAVVEEMNKKFNAASAELDAYIRSLNQQYAGADIHCSLDFRCPLSSYKYITTQYGQGGHKGVDLAAPQGTPIYAAADGVVTVAAYHYSYGNYVSIYHGSADDGNTYATLYAHMSQAPSVSTNQQVKKGDLIGYVGNTGYSFGNHLHLELRVNGNRTNPLSYIPH